jgi:dTMP kinase
MDKRARFITLEGVEGCGKTTQTKLLVERLQRENVSFIFTREPGGTRIGDQIRKILLHPENTDLTPLAELLLYEASRAQHVQQVILPNLQSGRHVICDRYGDASLAYQGVGRGLTIPLVREANHLATGGLQPDLTILLDVEPEIGLARARARNLQIDFALLEEGRFEEEDVIFHRNVRAAYLALANAEPHRFRIVDAQPAPETVSQRIFELVIKELGMRNKN